MKTIKPLQLLFCARINQDVEEVCLHIMNRYKEATLDYNDNGEKIVFETMIPKDAYLMRIRFNIQFKYLEFIIRSTYSNKEFKVPFEVFESEESIEKFIKKEIKEWKENNEDSLQRRIDYYIHKKQEDEKKEYAEYLRLKEKFDHRKKEKIKEINSDEYNAFHKAFNILSKLDVIDDKSKEKIFEDKDWRLLLKDLDGFYKNLTDVKRILEKE